MKKIFTIVTAILIGTCTYAQKNIFTESIGAAFPIDSDTKYENKTGVSYGISYQRLLGKRFGLMFSFNAANFQFNKDGINADAPYSKYEVTSGTGMRCTNFGFGVSDDIELGNSGFVLGFSTQIVAGICKSPSWIMGNYGTEIESYNDLQLCMDWGLYMYKMFGHFGVGFKVNEVFGLPLGVYEDKMLDYVPLQLKLVQRF